MCKTLQDLVLTQTDTLDIKDCYVQTGIEDILLQLDKELVGLDAFIYIWKRTDGYAWLGKFVGLPVIKQCAVFAYSILAFLLFWRFKIFNKS